MTKQEAMEKIADNLADLRQLCELSRDTVARESQTATSSLYQYEKGLIMPTAYSLWRLADYYGVTLDSLFE